MRKEYSCWDKKSLKAVTGRKSDFSELAKDCVAFANFKGGHIHIGIEDQSEMPPQDQIVTQDLAENVVKRLNELTINVGLSATIQKAGNGGQYIDLEIYRSQASVASTTKGSYYMRDNDKSRALLPDELARLIGDKPSYCWETKVSLSIKWDEADNKKLHRFETEIRNSDRVSSFVKEKTLPELLEYYLMVDERGMLTNLGVLWVGKRNQRAHLLYAPIVQYIKYNDYGEKVFKQVWDDYELNPEELLESIWSDIPEWRESNEISEGLWRQQVPAYDEKVVREALTNALVHRPYTTRGNIFINMYPDKMEIVNPGQLPYGVTTSTILTKSVQRNEHMAKIFYDLHLMEKEGSGYDLMYQVLLSWGKKLPIVEEGDDFVKLTINRRIIDKDANRLYDYLNDYYKLSQKSLIAFGIILQNKKIRSGELSKLLQLSDSSRLRDYLRSMTEQKIILSTGARKGTSYYINPKIITNSRANLKTTLKTIEPYRLKALIEEDLKYHPESTLAEISRRLPDIEYKDLQSMVRSMAREGKLLHDNGRKFRHYKLP